MFISSVFETAACAPYVTNIAMITDNLVNVTILYIYSNFLFSNNAFTLFLFTKISFLFSFDKYFESLQIQLFKILYLQHLIIAISWFIMIKIAIKTQ